MNAHDELTKGLAELRERGRTTAALYEKDGKVCPLGAMAFARGERLDLYYKKDLLWNSEEAILIANQNPYKETEAVRVLSDVILTEYPDKCNYWSPPSEVVWSFNDNKDVTQLDVETAFEKAISNTA